MTGRRSKFTATAVAAAVAVSLAACSGGSHALPTTAPGNTQNPVTATQSATAQMLISIPPKTTTSLVSRKYISASTQSMTIGLVSGSTTTPLKEVDLTPTSPNCTAQTGGGTQCSVNVVANAGNETFVLKMYDQTGGKGNLLSTGNVAATLVTGQSVNVPIAMDGVPSSVSLVLGTSTLPVGNPGSTSVVVQAQDAAGNIIVGPGGFSTPITLAIKGDVHNTLSLSSSTLNSPGQVVTLSYNGGSNTGSKIIPSIGSTAGTAATFNSTGVSVLNILNWSDPADNYYPYPYSVAALPNGTAVVEQATWSCISSPCSDTESLEVASTSGAQSMFIGDVTDPYNKPTTPPTYNGNMTVIDGMAQHIAWWWGEQDRELAAAPNGLVYYGGVYTSTSDPNCSGGSSSLGSIGAFDPAAHTVKEVLTKGVPSVIQVDPSGNVWFIEESGSCNATGTAVPYFPSGYAIGELPAGSTTVTETDIAQTGFPTNLNDWPAAMSLSADGSQMFIGDAQPSGGNNIILKVPTASLSGGTTIAPANLTWISTLATTPDGVTTWFSDTEPNYNYYYGYVPSSFAQADVVENGFPISGYIAYDSTYADGSVWLAGDQYGTGLGRISFCGCNTPTINYYQEPNAANEGQYMDGVSVAGGYVWTTDDDYAQINIMQYGAASPSLTTTQKATLRASMSVGRALTKNPYPTKRHTLSHPGYGKHPATGAV